MLHFCDPKSCLFGLCLESSLVWQSVFRINPIKTQLRGNYNGPTGITGPLETYKICSQTLHLFDGFSLSQHVVFP